jgi:hypothetical protein
VCQHRGSFLLGQKQSPEKSEPAQKSDIVTGMELPGTTPHDRARILLAKLAITDARIKMLKIVQPDTVSPDLETQMQDLCKIGRSIRRSLNNPHFEQVTNENHLQERNLDQILLTINWLIAQSHMDLQCPGFGVSPAQLDSADKAFLDKWGIDDQDFQLPLEPS